MPHAPRDLFDLEVGLGEQAAGGVEPGGRELIPKQVFAPCSVRCSVRSDMPSAAAAWERRAPCKWVRT